MDRILGISFYDVEAAFNAIPAPPPTLDSLNFKKTIERKLVSRVNEKRVVLFVVIILKYFVQNIRFAM